MPSDSSFCQKCGVRILKDEGYSSSPSTPTSIEPEMYDVILYNAGNDHSGVIKVIYSALGQDESVFDYDVYSYIDELPIKVAIQISKDKAESLMTLLVKLGATATMNNSHDPQTKHVISLSLPSKHQKPLELTPHEQQSISGLCLPMCVLRFIDAGIWTLIVISQISWGLGFWTIIWNVIVTGVSYLYAVRLLGVCRSKEFDDDRIEGLAIQNRDFSIICIIWYTVQFLFFYVNNLMFFSILIEIAILVIAIVTISRLKSLYTEKVRKHANNSEVKGE